MEFNFNCLFVALYIHCVKMKTFLCTEKKLLPVLPGSSLNSPGGGERWDSAYESGGDARRLA